jgi:hypothetical protein
MFVIHSKFMSHSQRFVVWVQLRFSRSDPQMLLVQLCGNNRRWTPKNFYVIIIVQKKQSLTTTSILQTRRNEHKNTQHTLLQHIIIYEQARKKIGAKKQDRNAMCFITYKGFVFFFVFLEKYLLDASQL